MQSYERNGVFVVRPGAYLDVAFKKAGVPQAMAQIERGTRTVLFNLEDAELINSYGISALLLVFDELSRRNGRLAFCGVKALMVRNALQISGLVTFCADHLYETEAEALAALA